MNKNLREMFVKKKSKDEKTTFNSMRLSIGFCLLILSLIKREVYKIPLEGGDDSFFKKMILEYLNTKLDRHI